MQSYLSYSYQKSLILFQGQKVLITIKHVFANKYMHILIVLVMNENYERIIPIEQELKETQEDLIRANKTIRTLNDTARSYETTIRSLKRKLENLEAKKVEQPPNQFLAQEKIQELTKTVEHLNTDIAQLKQVNKDLMAHKIELEKKMIELKQADVIVQKHKEGKAKLEKEIESLKLELEMSKQKDVKIVPVSKDKESDKKVVNLEKQLAQARKQISELQASNQTRPISDTPKSKNSDIESIIPTISNSEALGFYDGVNLLLEAFEDPQIEYPSNNAKILKLIDDYLSKLLPKFQLSFLNILTANAQAKMELIDQNNNLFQEFSN